jgi:hypothetical protein
MNDVARPLNVTGSTLLRYQAAKILREKRLLHRTLPYVGIGLNVGPYRSPFDEAMLAGLYIRTKLNSAKYKSEIVTFY